MTRASTLFLAAVIVAATTRAGTVRVATAAALQRALRAAKPGTRILIAPGTYSGYFSASNLRGTAGAPILIGAEDPKRPPVLRGRGECLHLTNVSHVVLRGLVLERASGNGLNIDDGGDYATPSHHVILDGLVVRDIGPRGNRDGIKLSGLDDFLVRRCTVERWGSGGSAIDMVGCHRGLITECTFRHRKGSGGSGIQAKGGSRDVAIHACRFEHAGQRAVNLGGSTGLPYFRPKDTRYEAKRIVAIANTFVGSMAPICYVTSEDCEASFNTIYRPAKWVFRILQESRGERFVACRNGVFRRNLVVWRRGDVRTFVNIGPHTQPETFRIEANWWFCEDAPAQSRPRLPVAEKAPVIGRDPGLKVDTSRGFESRERVAEAPPVMATAAPDHGAHSKLAAREAAQLCRKLAPWAFEQAQARSGGPR